MTKILIVDDDKPIRDLLKVIFASKGMEVFQAENGDSGIALAREEKPDIMVLDMNMPGMTGWEVLPLLKSHPDTKLIPVVALSAHSSSESRDQAYGAGCDLYINKPIDPAKILTAVLELLATKGK